jgi:hypothetical protein
MVRKSRFAFDVDFCPHRSTATRLSTDRWCCVACLYVSMRVVNLLLFYSIDHNQLAVRLEYSMPFFS